METFDTNVVLRILYRDDPAQAERARQSWERAVKSGGVYLTTTVLIELAWVLRAAAKFDRSAVVSALTSLCDSEGATVELEHRVRRALDRYATGPADFSDYMVLETARDAAALPVVTFDEALGRDADATIPPKGGP